MKEISVRVFDDLDYARDGLRNEAVTTITVGLDGTWRELDLTRDNEKSVRAVLEELLNAGRERGEAPVLPAKRIYHAPRPERANFFKGLREWCQQTGRRNAADTGWAYQTSISLQYYYGKEVVEQYQAYLDQQARR